MDALRYVLVGMGCMGLLILGSCSIMSYQAIKAAESATERGIETFDELETSINDQVEREREKELFGEGPQDFEEVANEEEQ